jgi:hypothetical protein
MSPAVATSPAAAAQASATSPAVVPVALTSGGLDQGAGSAASAAATPVSLTPAAAASASAQDISLSTAPSTAAAASDDLATVRATDPQAAERIASYCANSSAGNGSATCRRDEREAWTRLVLHNEFPALDDATRQKCNQPPFPDSYRAKEICAKYELRVY